MNDKIIKLGLDSGMLNYIDHETPRHYFLCGFANEQDLEKFAELIIQECGRIADNSREQSVFPSVLMREHFGVNE